MNISPRPTLQDGQVWDASLANASINPTIDGADRAGSIQLVTDQNMSDVPGNLKPTTYNFLNRVKVSIGAGLAVSFTGSTILLGNGTLYSLQAGQLVLSANSTLFVYISSTGPIAASTSLPNECIPLAIATTSANAVTQLLDIRNKVIEQVTPRYLPPQFFQPGDIKYTVNRTLEAGWLRCEGQAVSTNDYPALFSAIGFTFGGSGSVFNVPDYRGRVIIGSGTSSASGVSRNVGEAGGVESRTLSAAEMPNHSHGVMESPHTHIANSDEHIHQIADKAHEHTGIIGRDTPQGNYVSANLAGGILRNENGQIRAGGELTGARDKVEKLNFPTVFTDSRFTGIDRTQPAKSNVTLNPISTGIQIGAAGGNAASSVMQPYGTCNVIIRAI